MSQRDSGWIQLFAESNQEALDLHVQAFRLAEELSVPVMVCMDGFVLTHAVERIDLPAQEQVDAFVPAFEPRQVLDPADPVTIGAMVGPEAFTEVKYLAHVKQMQALDAIPQIAGEFEAAFGRPSGGLVRSYRAEGRCSARSRTWSTNCATTASLSGRSRSSRSGRGRWTRCARRCAARGG
jgi:pyruvate ferredoxin oxidoreductase alpha subunit